MRILSQRREGDFVFSTLNQNSFFVWFLISSISQYEKESVCLAFILTYHKLQPKNMFFLCTGC